MKKFGIIFLYCLFHVQSQADHLISYQLQGSYDQSQVDSIYSANNIPTIVISAENGIDLYKVIYSTITPSGDSTIASGAVIVPTGIPCALPLSSYQHGTVLGRYTVPSYGSYELIIGLIAGGQGYMVQMPDYLGLGDSPGFHPYVHAKSEATAVVDMLRASRELADTLNIRLNDQIFLFGYSQGGHATMAAHREIETYHSTEFQVTASCPMAGPYDVSGVQTEVLVSDSSYPAPSYAPYIIFAYQSVYGNLYDTLSHFVMEPWATDLPPLFTGTNGLGSVEAIMPSVPKQIFFPHQVDSFLTDTVNHALWLALRDNDVHDWVPQAPITMFYCEADKHINYMNAVVAHDKFRAAGATGEIKLVSGGATLDHTGCVEPALLYMKVWFEGFKSNGMELVSDVQNESVSGAMDGIATISVTGGSSPYQYLWSNGTTDNQISNAAAGRYHVTVSDSYGCESETSVDIDLDVTGFSQSNLQAVVEIFPNPAQTATTLSVINSPGETITLELKTLAGQIVAKNEFNSQDQYFLPLSEFARGIYLLELNLGERVVRKKIVLN